MSLASFAQRPSFVFLSFCLSRRLTLSQAIFAATAARRAWRRRARGHATRLPLTPSTDSALTSVLAVASLQLTISHDNHLCRARQRGYGQAALSLLFVPVP